MMVKNFKYEVNWNPINRATNGPKKLAVLTGDRINEGFFYKKMYGHLAPQ